MATFEDVKRELTGGQAEALERKLFRAAKVEEQGDAILRGVLAGTHEIRIVQAIQKLFDRSGRRIPKYLGSPVCDPNLDFTLAQPRFNYATRLARIVYFLTTGEWFISAAEFERQSMAVLDRLRAEKRTANLIRGVHLPFALPPLAGDYGTLLDGRLLPAVGASYQGQFPGRTFTNHRQGTLAHQMTVAEGSWHDRMVQALAAGPVVGIYFPDALRGFSTAAALEQMAGLPDHILLAGAFEPAVAIVAYPDVLARDFHTPRLDCTGVRGQSPFPLCFKADDDRLSFYHRGDLGVNDNYSAGLVVLGQ